MPTETFGHEPVTADVGTCGMGGCQCPGHYAEEVCARCVRVVPETDGPWRQELVVWPCTSAIVLGVVPREAS